MVTYLKCRVFLSVYLRFYLVLCVTWTEIQSLLLPPFVLFLTTMFSPGSITFYGNDICFIVTVRFISLLYLFGYQSVLTKSIPSFLCLRLGR